VALANSVISNAYIDIFDKDICNTFNSEKEKKIASTSDKSLQENTTLKVVKYHLIHHYPMISIFL